MKQKIILCVCIFLILACLVLAVATARVQTREDGTIITWDFGKMHVEYIRQVINNDSEPRWVSWIRIAWGYKE